MLLVLGLGNIGKEYENTNHNAGFIVLDILSREFGFKFNKRGCDADYAEANIGGNKVIFAKPRTYMNNSGIAAKSLLKKFGIKSENMLVLVDDIDLKPGEIRIRKSGSGGTHNGLKSITGEVGEEFPRVRISVGKPHENQDLKDFVLSKMVMDELQKQALSSAAEAAKMFVTSTDLESIMRKFNRKTG